MAASTTTDWRLNGTVFVSCNCDYGCPCNFNALPTQGFCEGGWTWNLDHGHLGDVSLDGLSFSMYAAWPKAIHDGDGEALMLIDERASQAQRETMESFLRGKIGGPWAILANTFVTYHGPQFLPYAVDVSGDRSSVSAGDVFELSTEPIRNPVTQAEIHPRMVLPEGMILKEGALLASSVFRVQNGVSYDHSGKYAALADFEYKPA